MSDRENLNARLETIHNIIIHWERDRNGDFTPTPGVVKAFRYALDALRQICETLHPAAAAVEASKPITDSQAVECSTKTATNVRIRPRNGLVKGPSLSPSRHRSKWGQ